MRKGNKRIGQKQTKVIYGWYSEKVVWKKRSNSVLFFVRCFALVVLWRVLYSYLKLVYSMCETNDRACQDVEIPWNAYFMDTFLYLSTVIEQNYIFSRWLFQVLPYKIGFTSCPKESQHWIFTWAATVHIQTASKNKFRSSFNVQREGGEIASGKNCSIFIESVLLIDGR